MVLSALHKVARLILQCHYPHFTGGEIKALCCQVVDPGFEPEQPSSRSHALTTMQYYLPGARMHTQVGLTPKAGLSPHRHIPSSPPDNVILLPADSKYES